MTPADVDRVFGRGRVKMVTGEHVEVYREAALPGERRRYTKRFLATDQGDFRHWTEREWRILARLVGHRIGPVPDVVQFDRGDASRPALVQTYDAGITVDHWATLLPVERQGQVLRHVFDDCAHWWALAQHCLIALDAIHELQLVHLDLKADNVCIPLGPADFDPRVPGQLLHPLFTQVTLIDFAFSLVSGENLGVALPIAHQGEYDYQSPRLLRALEAGRRGDLQPTRQLDWRCDVFSLAAMLRRYLPQRGLTAHGGWTDSRLAQAQGLVSRLFDAHHGPLPVRRPHRQWITFAERVLNDPALTASLARGWQLTSQVVAAQLDGPTPVTRIAVPVAPLPLAAAVGAANDATARAGRRSERVRRLVWATGALALGALAVPLIGETWLARHDAAAPVAAVDPAAAGVSAPEVVVAQAPADVASAPPATAAASAVPVASAAVMAAASAAPASAAVETAAAPKVEPKQEAREAEARPAPASEPVPPPVPAPAVAVAANPVAANPVAATAVVAAAKAPAPTSRAAATASARKAAAHSASIARAALKPAPASRFAAKRFTLPAIPPPPAPDVNSAVVVSQATLRVSAPAPAPAPAPGPAANDALVATELPGDFDERASELIAHHVPRIAQRAERRVLRVLHVASQAESSWQTSAIFDAARALRMPADEVVQGVRPASGEARSLNDAAGSAFWSGRNVQRALTLQLRAFGANPNDREVVGNLAFYYLKQHPAQPELARQLALFALTLDDGQAQNGRIEDWTSLAIASALTGRTRDASNAWFVTLALSPQSVDRSCRAALAAYASHGERLREPTEAMLSRISAWGRSQESPFCRWPPSWSARVRMP